LIGSHQLSTTRFYENARNSLLRSLPLLFLNRKHDPTARRRDLEWGLVCALYKMLASKPGDKYNEQDQHGQQDEKR
jgi:hypothetical protein